MAGMNIKKGDKVLVISGKDRGTESTVLRALPAKQRVVVEKCGIVTKAMRPTQANPQGGLTKVEAPIHVSNVMLVCPKCGKGTRIGYSVLENGTKVRVCKKCGANIEA